MRSEAQRDLEKENLLDSRLAYQGKIIGLKLETYRLGQKTKIAEIVRHPGAVVIVPVDAEGNLLLVRQWRRAANEILIELPAGTLEPNEPPATAALRELQEETGYAAKALIPLGGFFSAPGFCTEYLHLFAAEGLSPAPLPPDDDEQIDLLSLPLADAFQMIEKGEIQDAKTIAGLFRYQLWKNPCATSF